MPGEANVGTPARFRTVKRCIVAKASIPNQIIELLQQFNAGRITPAHIQALLEMPDEMLGILAKSRGRPSKKENDEYLLLADGDRFLKAYPDGAVATVVTGEVNGVPFDVEKVLPDGWWGNGFIVQRGGQSFLITNGTLSEPFRRDSITLYQEYGIIAAILEPNELFLIGDGWRIGPFHPDNHIKSVRTFAGHTFIFLREGIHVTIVADGKIYGPYGDVGDTFPTVEFEHDEENGQIHWSFDVYPAFCHLPGGKVIRVRDGVESPL
ncbi:hypothetical protein EPO34_01205 [Patescibacteria group bacterium]|nr:MAG: hypothetical protein EPO34_01205 [Patescibacteria group bacterium]